MSELEKMDYVMNNMDWEALTWYLYEDSRRPFRSWSKFREQLLERFLLNEEGTLITILIPAPRRDGKGVSSTI